MITHPSTNRARRRVTTLIKTNALLLSQATTCRLGQIHFHTLLNVPLNLDPLLTAPLRLVVLIPLPIRTHALVVFVDLQMCWISERLSRGSYGCNWGRDRGGDRDLPTLCRDETETFEKYVLERDIETETTTLDWARNWFVVFSELQWMTDIYYPPWCRAGPYFVGVLLGFILFRVNGRLKINRVGLLFMYGWLKLHSCITIINLPLSVLCMAYSAMCLSPQKKKRKIKRCEILCWQK